MKKSFITVCLATIMLSGSAIAQVYVSGVAGKGDADQWPGNPSVYLISVGYQFGDHWAIGTSYVDFGQSESGDKLQIFEADGVGIRLTGILPIGERVELFAKLGFLSWDLKYVNLAWWISGKLEGEDINYGLGAAFKCTKKLSLFAEYHIYNFEFYAGYDDELTTISGGLRVLF